MAEVHGSSNNTDYFTHKKSKKSGPILSHFGGKTLVHVTYIQQPIIRLDDQFFSKFWLVASSSVRMHNVENSWH